MTDSLEPSRLDRAELISLLETLGSENDEEVLAAARVLDTKVSAAGTSWNVLLAAGRGVEADPADEDAHDDDGGEEDAPAVSAGLPADTEAKNAETLALIGRLLGRGGHSEAFREELEGYKADIAAGEMTDADHSYVRALYKRLTG
ncbi:hypothetical protein [Pelagibius sp. 7325]|uniref:hypothetical protein n=1 Tax=Pelagibius sp. 7325 TaxID=3131994 RepID=UPI0030ED9D3C